MAIGKRPRTTLMNFNCAAHRARSEPGNDNGNWQTTSHYSDEFQVHRAGRVAHLAMTMAIGKLPCATLVNFSFTARRARGAPGNDLSLIHISEPTRH
eukprot:8506962-Karenia_brevis.AAC.1